MKKIIALIIIFSLLCLNGCSNRPLNEQTGSTASQDQNSVSSEASSEQLSENPSENQDNAPLNKKILSKAELQSIHADESGEVMVLMYHNIGEEEATWTRTPENFKKDLQTLYDRGFRAISLEDYVQGKISTEKGFTPVVITFDDGRENNFRYLEDGLSKQIDPECALGIMEEFKISHPDFNMTATFFLNGLAFGVEEQEKDKLEFLSQNGYSIGNHTLTHPSLRSLSAEDIQKEIATLKQKHENTYPEANINTLALPFGEKPKGEDFKYTYKGSYQGAGYENIAVLLVGWDPYLSPFDKDFDFSNIHRVRGSETNVDNVGLYNWLDSYDKGSKQRYISDGNPNTIAIPKSKMDKIDTGRFSQLEILTY